jgi:putative transposase
LQDAVRLCLTAEKEKSWFPGLPVLVHLLACIRFQIAQMHSLREVVQVHESDQKKGALGKLSVLRRSTFAEANNSRRRLRVIREVFAKLVESSQRVPRKWRRLKNIAALDATILHAVTSADWADYRKNVNACKGHLLFDLARSAPKQIVLTAGRTHDRMVFSDFLVKGWTYIVDRAYNDYKIFDAIESLGAYFVTRMKVGAVYQVIKKHRVSRVHRKAGVLSDQTILLGQCSTRMVSPVRLVSFQTPDGSIYDYITNRFDLSALTVAELYRARWGIEIFFKWLKRTLRIERPLGRSAIAYEMHVLMTLITDILLKIFSSLPPARRHTPVVLLRFIRENLFSRLSKEVIRCIIQLGQT